MCGVHLYVIICHLNAILCLTSTAAPPAAAQHKAAICFSAWRALTLQELIVSTPSASAVLFKEISVWTSAHV